MAHPEALINPPLLVWARERAGLDLEDAADSVKVKHERWKAWELGEARPTFKQAQTIAAALHLPFGYLFLANPPIENLPLPDLRTVAGEPLGAPSLDLLDTVRIALQRQAWFIDHQIDIGASELPFVGRFNYESPPVEVAAHMRAVLGVAVEGGGNWETFARDLIRAAEEAGVLVMRSGIVGNNTHRKLDVGEFRGFALSDRIAPLIFINAADAPSARLFTFAHELAHIWIGSTGVSNVALGNNRREEVVCNAIAAEFLVPAALFLPLWQASDLIVEQRVAALAKHFHVSQLVIMRRALQSGLVDRQVYLAHYLAQLQTFRDAEGGGGNFYRNAGAKNSVRFARAVIAEAKSGRLLMRDAGRLLGVQPSKINVFAEQLEK
jgi:Zn-dependent peptidase ImmA (M78 family)/transcriptional regulator with XRE-family HTH domain